MTDKRIAESFILGALLCAGLVISSYVVSDGFTRFKAYERTVVVKGLSEQEAPADVAIWPISFTVAGSSERQYRCRYGTPIQMSELP